MTSTDELRGFENSESCAGAVTILDGGMGRQLKAMGAPFRQPEWSALALIEAPHYVLQAHDQYVVAGAEVLTTNSYAVVPFHIGADRFNSDGSRLAKLAGELARASADAAGRQVLVAGSLPPACGSYQPELYKSEESRRILGVLVDALHPYTDLWLAETLSSTVEAYDAAHAIAQASPRRPLWLSFSLVRKAGGVALHSGESVTAAVQAALATGAEALLFNCAAPEFMTAALAEASLAVAAARKAAAASASPARGALAAEDSDSDTDSASSSSSFSDAETAAKKLRPGSPLQAVGDGPSPSPAAHDAAGGGVPSLRFGVYANVFGASEGPANAVLNKLRLEVTPELYAEFAQEWRDAGASIVGGCCGVGPEHIRALARSLNAQPAAAAVVL